MQPVQVIVVDEQLAHGLWQAVHDEPVGAVPAGHVVTQEEVVAS